MSRIGNGPNAPVPPRPDLPDDSIADAHQCRGPLALIRQRQSLFRLAFDDRRVTRAMLRAQAVEFERWLAGL